MRMTAVQLDRRTNCDRSLPLSQYDVAVCPIIVSCYAFFRSRSSKLSLSIRSLRLQIHVGLRYVVSEIGPKRLTLVIAVTYSCLLRLGWLVFTIVAR